MKTTFLLGAGFSFHAGLPMVNDITNYFTPPFAENLLKFSSGEWKWTHFASQTDLHNGSLGVDRIPIGYYLEFLVEKYLENNSNFNYEEFYQWFLDIKNWDTKVKEWNKEVNRKIIAKYGNDIYDGYLINDIFSYYSKIHDCFIHLMDDLLYVRKPWDEIKILYENFITSPSKSACNYITLNHDMLLERLFFENEIRYSDGFSSYGSNLMNEKKEKIKVFSNDFSIGVKLIKLHGSIDLYKYLHYNEEGARLEYLNDYTYFKTNDYYEKHFAIRIDIETGQVVQTLHSNIIPQFITGADKSNRILNDKFFKILYKEAENEMVSSDTLIIIGYSFSDKHINSIIIKGINEGTVKNIIVVNPNRTLVLPLEFNKIEFNQINDIRDLKTKP
jgi:hypothetical protein